MNEEQVRRLLQAFQGTAFVFRGAHVKMVRFEVDGKEADMELANDIATSPLVVLMAGNAKDVEVPEGLSTVLLE